MKLTNKQQQEIAFLERHFGGVGGDAEDYVLATTKGIKDTTDKLSKNPLRIAKQRLDRNIKMWRQGLEENISYPHEFMEEFGDSGFGKKLVISVVESVPKWKYWFTDQARWAREVFKSI